MKFASLASTVTADIGKISPETSVRPHLVEFDDAWDFQGVYGALHDFARAYPFNRDADAGRQLCAASRAKRGTTNDADRLRKYLARFKLDWARIADGSGKRAE